MDAAHISHDLSHLEHLCLEHAWLDSEFFQDPYAALDKEPPIPKKIDSYELDWGTFVKKSLQRPSRCPVNMLNMVNLTSLALMHC